MRGRGTTRLVGLVIWLLAIGLTAAPADADPPGPGQQVFLTNVSVNEEVSYDFLFGSVFRFAAADGQTLSGTDVQISVSSCGEFIQQSDTVLSDDRDEAFVNFSPDGGPAIGVNSVNSRIGPSFDYHVTINEPGLDPYEYTGTFTNITIPRPSCATLHKPEVVVKRWSRIRGRALVGHTLSVSPTVAPGCHITYTWKAGSGPVAHGRRLVVKPRWRYMALSVVVKVTRPGYRSQSRRLRARG